MRDSGDHARSERDSRGLVIPNLSSGRKAQVFSGLSVSWPGTCNNDRESMAACDAFHRHQLTLKGLPSSSLRLDPTRIPRKSVSLGLTANDSDKFRHNQRTGTGANTVRFAVVAKYGRISFDA